MLITDLETNYVLYMDATGRLGRNEFFSVNMITIKNNKELIGYITGAYGQRSGSERFLYRDVETNIYGLYRTLVEEI